MTSMAACSAAAACARVEPAGTAPAVCGAGGSAPYDDAVTPYETGAALP
jgi:hypothetical protein